MATRRAGTVSSVNRQIDALLRKANPAKKRKPRTAARTPAHSVVLVAAKNPRKPKAPSARSMLVYVVRTLNTEGVYVPIAAFTLQSYATEWARAYAARFPTKAVMVDDEGI